MRSARCRSPLALVLGLVVATSVAAGCSGGGGSSSAKTTSHGSIVLTAGPVTVASAGAPATLPDTVRDQVVAALRQYVQVATVDPLRTGKPVGDLAPVFTAAALAQAQGPDRAVVLDEGLPRATGDVVAKAPPVGLTALTDANGGPVLVDATLALTVATPTSHGPVQIRRAGDVLFAPDAGTWKVLGYDLLTARHGKGVDAVARATTPTSVAR